MDSVKTWTVRIDIGEHEGLTKAVAHLQTRDTDQLTGVGTARLNPADMDVPEIGDELAGARALADLGQRLLDAAIEDVEPVRGWSAHPAR